MMMKFHPMNGVTTSWQRVGMTRFSFFPMVLIVASFVAFVSPCLSAQNAQSSSSQSQPQRRQNIRRSRRALSPSSRVVTRVFEIRAAQDTEPYIDPRLRRLENDLSPMPFNHYMVQKTTRRVLAKGGKVKVHFGLEHGLKAREFKLGYLGVDEEGRAIVSVGIPSSNFKTKVHLKPGATILIGGPHVGDETVIFALQLVGE